MNILISLFFLLPLAMASDVLEFKDSSFEQSVKEHSVILVEFYAPWCGHCKKLAPEYEIAATALKKQDPPIAIAKVDCTAETKTCEKHGVSGYPTLKVFKNGQFAFDYSGERSADGIIKYMVSKSGPSSKELKTEENFNKFTASADPVVVGFFTSESSDLYKTFLSVAEKLNEDFRFAHTFDETLSTKLNYKNNIVIFHSKKMANKFEDTQVKYKGDASEHQIRTWVEENIMGLAGHRTHSNVKYFAKRPLIVALYNVDYEKNPKGTNYWRNRILKVAKKIYRFWLIAFVQEGSSFVFGSISCVVESVKCAKKCGKVNMECAQQCLQVFKN